MPFKCGAQLVKVKLIKYLYYKNVPSGLYLTMLLRPIIPGPLASINPIFYKLEILKIKDIFTLQIAKFIYKSLSGDTPENFHEWFKLNCDSQHTILDLTIQMLII